ncbi:hypothetical protein AB0G04_10435 [Actinoplanes sp. NPDC023801]|uniref:hypothetical protein n=1 Tax=Actinoplanes sp. NPDC023801 TaxID=3154595 RepID=UPI0033FF487B
MPPPDGDAAGSSARRLGPGMDELTDFLWQMEIAAWEEAWLFEIPLGSIDSPGPWQIVHGPWPAPTCAAVLRLWYDAGWIGLHYRDPPPGWDVGAPHWRDRVSADGYVQLYRADEGETTLREQWFEHVIDIARGLPLRP